MGCLKYSEFEVDDTTNYTSTCYIFTSKCFLTHNGSIKGLPHCDEVGCEMVDGHCVRTTHAEANAIVQAAKNGIQINQSEIYVTASPCYECFKLIANAGINVIYYDEFYRDKRIIEKSKEIGIQLASLED